MMAFPLLQEGVSPKMVNKRFAQSKFHRIVPTVVTHGLRFEEGAGLHL